MFITVREHSLLAAYYEARLHFVESARVIREGAAAEPLESWEARMEAARKPFVEAERALVDDIMEYGDIETDTHRYEARWVADLREFRLKVTPYRWGSFARGVARVA